MISASTQRSGTSADGMAVQRADIVEAARVLAALGLVTAYGHVSVRVGAVMVITPAADLATVTESALVEVPLSLGSSRDGGTPHGGGTAQGDGSGEARGSTAALPPGAPAEAWAHLAIYRTRPDVHAIARAQPPSAFAAAAVSTELLPLHGQAAWLGTWVPVYDSAHLLRTAELADRAAGRLPTGEALLLRGNGALTLGATPGIAVARMWLLAAACDTWLAAGAAGGISAAVGTGSVTPLTPEEISSWRAVADELLPRLWQHLARRHLRQQDPRPLNARPAAPSADEDSRERS
jgi:HCOMODA/2-hydroxy-3-carboxy-muconic semialdehyde decarboxylase